MSLNSVRNASFPVLAAILMAAGCATRPATQEAPTSGKAPETKPAAPAKAEAAAPARRLDLYAPANGAVVPTLSDGQKAYLTLPRAERVKKFASQTYRSQMKALGYYPKPLKLAWSNATASATSPAKYTVELFRLPGETAVFTTNFVSSDAGLSVLVDNLEIARDYRWRVTSGSDTATSAFKTEDMAPRLIRLPGVPNVRDLGGRVGLDGRRVKQGLVYRSAGLNDNASTVYYTAKEIAAKKPEEAKRYMDLDAAFEKWRGIEASITNGVDALHIVDIAPAEKWTLFLPALKKSGFATNGIPAITALKAIPAEFLGAKAETISIEDGTNHVIGEVKADAMAVLMQEVESPEDGFMAITAGGDYWWELRSNGASAINLVDVGNWRSPYGCTNYKIAVPVRKGRNLIVATVFSGTGGWSWGWAKYTGDAAALAHDVARVFEKSRDQPANRVPKSRTPGRFRLKGAALDYALNTMGIKSDIDLRSDGECWGMTGSPLGDTVTWFHYSSGAYAGMQTTFGREAFTKVFRVFLDEKNYPIDFHCIAGQDRTGAVAFIINGLLGVEEEELYRDWESTGFWNGSASFCHKRLFDHLVAGFNKWPGDTINDKIEAYVLALGFTKDDIAKLRDIMLEK